jgi:hypothetical protein
LTELYTCLALADALGAGGAGVSGTIAAKGIGGIRDIIDLAVTIVVKAIALFGLGWRCGAADTVSLGIAGIHAILASALFIGIAARIPKIGHVIDDAIAIVIDIVVAKLGFGEHFAFADCRPLSICADLCSCFTSASSFGASGAGVTGAGEGLSGEGIVIDFSIAVIVDAVADFGGGLDVIDEAIAIAVFAIADLRAGDNLVEAFAAPCAIGCADFLSIATDAFAACSFGACVAGACLIWGAAIACCLAKALYAGLSNEAICLLEALASRIFGTTRQEETHRQKEEYDLSHGIHLKGMRF